MKKILALVLALTMMLTLAACGGESGTSTTTASTTTTAASTEATTTAAPEVTVMTYEEYAAAELDTEVVIEACVQATQGWWSDEGQGKITVYAQDADGAYFIYEMACEDADAEKLVPGARIRVTGYKAEWAGEVEIVDATFEFVDGDSIIATPVDMTDKLGTDELIDYQNQFVSFTGLTVEGIAYKNDEPGDDIYVTVSKDGASYDFCVEAYLTGADTEVYKAVGELKTGDVIDLEGFLYWYEGVNTHITAITNVVAAPSVMTYADYAAAELDTAVVVEAYVQATQGWWSDNGQGKITVYAQDADGAYFIYEMACEEADAANLVPGTKIRVSGYKAEWAGEVEIIDATFEFVADADTFVAEPVDMTEKLGTDELINYQNQFVSFTGLTVEAISYKNDEPGDDIYVTVGYNGASYDFCVEAYLTGADTEVYKTVGELAVGDVINVEGFLYWYEGVNTHITAVTKA